MYAQTWLYVINVFIGMFFACLKRDFSMKLSVGLKVANSLSLTPQLQQAIRLLQLSSLELEQEIQIQLDSNPLLEKIEEINTAESFSSL